MPAFDASTLDALRVQQVLAAHPPTAGVLVLDDPGLPKKGTASVGVAAQYSGTLGKVGNCQVVVSAEYLADDPASSSPFHWPVSAHLYLPASWTSDPAHRKRAHVPAQISQRTKPEMALGLLDQAGEWGVPVHLVGVDSGSGDHPHCLQGLDARHLPYVCAVESTFGVRWPTEGQEAGRQVPVYQGLGQPRKPRPAPLYTVKQLIATLPASAWQTIRWREGTRGSMQAQAVALRVRLSTGAQEHSPTHHRVHTGPEGWLLAERPAAPTTPEPAAPPATPEKRRRRRKQQPKDPTNYWFSTLPPDATLEHLVTLAHARWVVEPFYEDAKQECGLDH